MYTNEFAFRLTKEQYDYLIPIYRSRLLYIPNGIAFKNGDKKDLFSFIGSREDFTEVLARCRYLDEDLKSNSDYTERLNYNTNYNGGVRFKQIHH